MIGIYVLGLNHAYGEVHTLETKVSLKRFVLFSIKGKSREDGTRHLLVVRASWLLWLSRLDEK